MSWIENIEALTNATDHLKYANQLISRGDVKSELRKRLSDELEMVRKRVEDEGLYIAVIGRASTGKSTLINALLGDDLLESGVLHMTTAAATLLRYGEEITVEVYFHGPNGTQQFQLSKNSITYHTHNSEILISGDKLNQNNVWRVTPADEPISEPALPGVENLTIREFIRYITTENPLAKKIAKISITLPSEFLKSGLIIIDTPGADAQNQTHKEIMRRAVEHSDAAIIITPAEQTVSRWLINLIEEPDFLQPFLHRCIFVVTRMDIARERMRRSARDDAITLIHEDAIQRLRSGLTKFDLPQEPRLYITAAQAVVDTFSGGEPGVANPEDREYWQREFAKFQKDLFDYITYQRSLTIAESVLRLLDDLFQSIEAHLAELWVDYNDRRSRLNNITEDIDSFGNEQKKLCSMLVRKASHTAVQEVEFAVGRERDRVLGSLQDVVYGVSSVEDLQNVVNEKVKKRLSQSRKTISTEIKKQTTSINKEALSFNTAFEKKFNELYEELKLLGIANNHARSDSLTLSSVNPGASLQGSGALENNTIEKVVSGAVIGGVIGSFIPIVGTVFGAVVGGIIGSLFGPSLDERKKEVWNELRPKIVNYFSSLLRESTRAAKEYGTQVENNFQNRIDNHVKRYRIDVNRMRERQLREQRELEELQSTLEKDLNELKIRRSRVQAQQKRLRQAIEGDA